MFKGTEIRQQLRNQNLEELLTSTINTVGKRIFPDDLAVLDLEALNQIVESWRSTHVSTYGNVLPNTGVIAESISDGGGIEPSNNQVIDITALSVANAGAGAPIEFQLRIGDLPIFGAPIPPSQTVTSSEFGAIFPLTLSKGLALKFVVTSGTSSDFSGKIAYVSRCI
jgi:hypothetical protein